MCVGKVDDEGDCFAEAVRGAGEHDDGDALAAAGNFEAVRALVGGAGEVAAEDGGVDCFFHVLGAFGDGGAAGDGASGGEEAHARVLARAVEQVVDVLEEVAEGVFVGLS